MRLHKIKPQNIEFRIPNSRRAYAPTVGLSENSESRIGILGNEKGIALVIVMVLSAIGLALMAGLIYMLTSGTQISGIQKRYKTALEAGTGGSDITLQLIKVKDTTKPTFAEGLATFTADLASLSPSISTPTSCTGTITTTGTPPITTTYTGIEAKLKTSTKTWTGCDSSLTIDPANASPTPTTPGYDMKFDLGSYRIYTKIVDTVEGNSVATNSDLEKLGVVSSNTGEMVTLSRPYLFTIEIDAEKKRTDAEIAANPISEERAKLSVLYQY